MASRRQHLFHDVKGVSDVTALRLRTRLTASWRQCIVAVLNLRLFQLGRLLTCVALFGMLELHWVSLQSVAWVKMIRSDLQQVESSPDTDKVSVLDGVVRNVSGDNPCDLCRAITEEQSNERDQEREVRSSQRVEMVPAESRSLWLRPHGPERLNVVSADEQADSWRAKPASPPPRSC